MVYVPLLLLPLPAQYLCEKRLFLCYNKDHYG